VSHAAVLRIRKTPLTILKEIHDLNDIDLLCQTTDVMNVYVGIGGRVRVLRVIRKSFAEVTITGHEKKEATHL